MTSFRLPVRQPLPEGAVPRHGSEPYAVAGIAWDGSTTNRPGARFGPRAIRQASHMLCDGMHPLFDVTPDGQLGDAGDLPLPNTSLEGMRAALPPLVDALIRRHHMAWLGGDHSITLPLLRGYRRWLGRPLAVIHFDAHCDTWSDHFGEPSGHGTWVYEAMQEGLVVDECFTQLGIRSAGEREAREYVREQGGLIFDARAACAAWRAPAQLAPVLAHGARAAGRARPPAALPEPGHRLPGPGLRPGHRHAGARRPEHQPGAHRARGTGRPALRRHGLRRSGPTLRPCRTDAAMPPRSFVWTYLCGCIARGTGRAL